MKKSDLKFIPNFFDRYIALVDDHTHLIDGLKTSDTILENVSEKLVQHQEYRYELNKPLWI